MGSLQKLTLNNIKLFAKHHLTDQPTNYPEQDKELGIVSMSLNLESFYADLLNFGSDFSIIKATKIRYHNELLPIYQIDIGKDGNERLFILSGTHGNEHAGILCILKLLHDIRNNPDFYNHLNIRILVPHNPVGTKYFSRFNENGVDINRDFKKKRTKEATTAISSIEDFKPTFAISLHEGPQDSGTFIYCNSLVDHNFALNVLAYAKQNRVKLADKNYFSGKLRVPGYFPLIGISLLTVKLWSDLLNLQPEGYYTSLNGIPNITIETPWKSHNFEERLNGQLQIINGVVNGLR